MVTNEEDKDKNKDRYNITKLMIEQCKLNLTTGVNACVPGG